jgi:hypothetical protein
VNNNIDETGDEELVETFGGQVSTCDDVESMIQKATSSKLKK